MGAVYRAHHAMMQRPTAVKTLHADQITDASIARFEREVQLCSQLNHPNTIAIYDYGRTPEGLFYYAMEYLDGLPLDEFVEKFGPLPEGRAIYLLRQICGSLAEAHQMGLIHRDIKPANIMVNRRGGQADVVKVLDFGLVKSTGEGDEVSLTRAGTMTGTPTYISPEAIDRPGEIDLRSDLYAVGAVGYFLITGTPPFLGTSIIELCMQHTQQPPQPPSERLGSQVAADFEKILLNCLAKKPEDRPESALVLQRRLEACADCQTWNQEASLQWWAEHVPQNSDAIVQAGAKPSATSSTKDTGLDETAMFES
jgi:serine/threonine protein kinase